MAKYKKLIGAAAAGAASMTAPFVAFAQTDIAPPEIVNVNDILLVVQAVIRFILILAFVLAFVFLLIGGLRWITAGGDDKAVASARGTITAALIGLVVVLVAYALIVLVETFFGVSIITGGVIIPTLQ